MLRHGIAVLAATVVGLAIAASLLTAQAGTRSGAGRSGPPEGLTAYGRTLWDLEALLHDTFGRAQVCLRLRDAAFVSSTCGDFGRYGYWEYMFAGARHSHFTLFRRARPPFTGNFNLVTMKGKYVFCGRYPVAFAGARGGDPAHRWLGQIHGTASVPLTCL